MYVCMYVCMYVFLKSRIYKKEQCVAIEFRLRPVNQLNKIFGKIYDEGALSRESSLDST